MKTFFPLLSLLLVIASCTEQKSTETVSDSESQDSLANASIHYDSTIYIGFVETFPETQEYYTSLYFHEDRGNSDEWSNLLDSVIFQTEEATRKRLPMEEARKLFVLENMDVLKIYDSYHTHVATATLVRVEHFQGPIEDSFIAVYKGDMFPKVPDQAFYGVSSAGINYRKDDFEIADIETADTEKAIAQHLGVDAGTCEFSHYAVLPDEIILSVATTPHTSFIVETKDNKVTTLSDLKEDTFVTSIFPLPYYVNNKPLIIVSEAVREGDSMWTSLAAFKDGGYHTSARSRMYFKRNELVAMMP
jgi:hypothetical protein